MKQKELQQHVERKSKEMELEKGDTAGAKSNRKSGGRVLDQAFRS